MYHTDPDLHGLQRRIDFYRFSLPEDLPLESSAALDHRHSEQNIHQRGFSCTVFSQKRMDLMRLHGELHILQYRVFPVLFRDMLHFQQICTHKRFSSFIVLSLTFDTGLFSPAVYKNAVQPEDCTAHSCLMLYSIAHGPSTRAKLSYFFPLTS